MTTDLIVEAPLDKLRRLQDLRQRLREATAVDWGEYVSHWYCDRSGCDGKAHEGWDHPHARAGQHPPEGDWLVWFIQAGRGYGKTRMGAEWILDQVWREGRKRVALVGRTPADIRDVMIQGDSGIMECSIAAGLERPLYEPTKRRLTWPTGAQAWTYSAAAADQLRGPQHEVAWCDETSSWFDARKGDVLDTSWNNLMLGLRLGTDPRCVVTTTPKPNRLTRVITERASTKVSVGTTYDNLDNLAPSFREQVLTVYEGTRIGRQELLGELLTDVEGALWTLQIIEEPRVADAPEMSRLVVGVDPTGADHSGADECGIIVAGKGADGEGYIIADRTVTASPAEWARRAVRAYHEFSCDKVVAEGNYGGQMVAETIKAVDRNVPVEIVSASRSKRQRAEPIAALYEQGRVHHVGTELAKLEDELTTWTPESGWSPGRMDALVWACHWLKLSGGGQGEAFIAAWKKKAGTTESPVSKHPESA